MVAGDAVRVFERTLEDAVRGPVVDARRVVGNLVRKQGVVPGGRDEGFLGDEQRTDGGLHGQIRRES